MKLKRLKLTYGIQIGGHSQVFLHSPEYEMHIDNQLILISHKLTNTNCITSLSNMVWAEELPAEPVKPPQVKKGK